MYFTVKHYKLLDVCQVRGRQGVDLAGLEAAICERIISQCVQRYTVEKHKIEEKDKKRKRSLCGSDKTLYKDIFHVEGGFTTFMSTFVISVLHFSKNSCFGLHSS